MKNYRTKLPVIPIFFSISILLYTNCSEENPIDDAQKIAALQNVTITFDSLSYEIGLPDGALNGKSFDSLMAIDSAKYANPANYTIGISGNFTADNTKEEAEDAKFDGMIVEIVMDTIELGPVQTIAEGFEIQKNTQLPVQTAGEINLKTHRQTGLYIFRQTVDGNDLATTLSPMLNYKIGIKKGSINVPDIHKDIPTRASEETKAFLSGLLESRIFEIPK